MTAPTTALNSLSIGKQTQSVTFGSGNSVSYTQANHSDLVSYVKCCASRWPSAMPRCPVLPWPSVDRCVSPPASRTAGKVERNTSNRMRNFEIFFAPVRYKT